MSGVHSWIESLWWRQQEPPFWLRAVEPVYAAINARNLERRSAALSEPPIPLISVGNITAGGSGKTPFVLWLAEQLIAADRKPVILSRGDGGSNSAPMLVDPGGSATLAGDEALLLAQTSGCPVIAAHDRIAGSRMAAKHGNIIILDDGFQYRHLGRCCDIVLVPTEGVGNGHQIPAGPLREPVSALTRADFIVRTGSSQAAPMSDQHEWQWQALPGALEDVVLGQTQYLPDMLAVTSIARPHRFFDDLRAMGITLHDTISFPDHHRFTSADLKPLLDRLQEIVVTAKDAVKLKSLWPEDRPLWQLSQRFEAENGLAEAILQHLDSQT